METIIVGKNDAGQRVDAFMKKLTAGSPQSLIYRYIRTNKIKINGKKPKPDMRLAEGDVITYFGDSGALSVKRFVPAAYSLDVVYEDENILAVNKPCGMACQPDDRHNVGTLIDNVKNYLYEKGDYRPSEENSFAPALCNRLDFNTEGLCLAAKNAESLRILNEKLKTREIRRFYMCVTQGVPPEKTGEIKNRVLKNTAENKSYIAENGKEALTKYRVLREKNGRALVELEIISGRTHQIRLHLASLGCPVLGDSKYGEGGNGQRLISHKTIFAFKTGAGILDYLKDMTVEIPTDRIENYLI